MDGWIGRQTTLVSSLPCISVRLQKKADHDSRVDCQRNMQIKSATLGLKHKELSIVLVDYFMKNRAEESTFSK